MKQLSAKLARAALTIGANHDATVLPVEDAWNVSAYINSQSRPVRADLDRDYCDRVRKPVGGPFLPFNGKSSLGNTIATASGRPSAHRQKSVSAASN